MAIYKCSREVQPGTTRIKFVEWSERVLNPGSPDLKASALTTGPHCLILLILFLFVLRTCFIYQAEFVLIYMVLYWSNFSLMFLIHLFLYVGVYCSVQYSREQITRGKQKHCDTAIQYLMGKIKPKSVNLSAKQINFSSNQAILLSSGCKMSFMYLTAT